MKTTSPQLKANAREHLTGRYGVVIIAYMMASLITNIPSLVISYTVNTNTLAGNLIDTGVTLILNFILTIFLVGQNHICLRYARGKEAVPVSEMWYGFRGRADEIIITCFLYFIRLLICSVPFIASLACYLKAGSPVLFGSLAVISLIFMIVMWIKLELDYGLIFFLIVDYPEESPGKLLQHSRQLMKGNRGRLFYLQLSFIGMYLLVLLSFGFAMFWVYPYTRMTFTEFYLDVNPSEEVTSVEEEIEEEIEEE